MNTRWLIIISSVVLIAVIVITNLMNIFNWWVFGGTIFYTVVFLFSYFYIVYGYEKRLADEDNLYYQRQKFQWCWNRVNSILRSMPKGQGLAWVSGVDRTSKLQFFFDGVQQKPYRSMLARLENSQSDVLIIYDIDADDIAYFQTNLHIEEYNNPFYRFNPFKGGSGGYGRGYYQERPDLYPRRRGSGRVNISVGGDDYGDYNNIAPENPVLPDGSVVSSALNKLRGGK